MADASVWIAVLLDEDINHDSSDRWLRGWMDIGQRIASPTILLPEVAGAVRRRTKSPDLAPRVLANLLQDPSLDIVPLGAELGTRAARLAIELRLRGADAVYVAVAQQLGVPLISWDREQRERASALIEVRTPPAVATKAE